MIEVPPTLPDPSDKKGSPDVGWFPRANWRNWGDHPIVVTVTLVGTILIILVTILGLPKLVRESFSVSPQQSSTSSSDIIEKSPAQLVAWYASLSDEFEAKRQAKILYVGKTIRLSGQPEIFAVTSGLVQFKFAYTSASINTKILSRILHSSLTYIFLCKIENFNAAYILVSDCTIEETEFKPPS